MVEYLALCYIIVWDAILQHIVSCYTIVSHSIANYIRSYYIILYCNAVYYIVFHHGAVQYRIAQHAINYMKVSYCTLQHSLFVNVLVGWILQSPSLQMYRPCTASAKTSFPTLEQIVLRCKLLCPNALNTIILYYIILHYTMSDDNARCSSIVYHIIIYDIVLYYI